MTRVRVIFYTRTNFYLRYADFITSGLKYMGGTDIQENYMIVDWFCETKDHDKAKAEVMDLIDIEKMEELNIELCEPMRATAVEVPTF
jgi:hypothetical protein